MVIGMLIGPCHLMPDSRLQHTRTPPPYHPPNHLRRTTQVLASSDAMTAGDFSNTENAAYQAGGRLVFAVAISVLYGNFDIPEQCFNLLCAVTVLWLL